MGKRNKGVTHFLFLFVVIIFVQNYSYAQTKIFGTIKDSNNSSLYSVSVILKDTLNTKTIAYTYSKDNGEYEVKTDKTGDFILIFTALGFEKKIISVQIDGSKKLMQIDVSLKDKPMNLDEVIIQAEIPMSIKKDTINFKTKFYAQGNEETVEQLLKTIPGLSISDEGTIKVGNQEIEKLMIDGDDLFEKGYKILSKNMPAYPIEEIEILKNYSNNKLLKGIENSNKVALNLKLNEKSKRIWFGNLEMNVGNDSFYQYKANLMNFGKKNKYYFLTNLNSIGYDATGDIEFLVRPLRRNEPGSVGDNQKVQNLIDLRDASLRFKKNRTDFNNSEMVSLNAIFNPTEKLKIKTISFLNWDETNLFRNSQEIVDVNDVNFTNTKNYKLRNKEKIAFGKLDFQYDISKTKELIATTKYNNGNFDNESNLLFNGNSTVENLKNNNLLFDQKVNYTNRFKDNKVFLLTGRFIHEKTPQNYTINQFFYEDLFQESSAATNVKQQTVNEMYFTGIEGHLLNRRENGNLFELRLSNEFRKDKLNTSFTLLDGETILQTPEDYQNQTEYQTNNISLKGKYQYKIDNFSLTGNLHLHQLFNKLDNNSFSDTQTPFFINPSIGMEWKLNDKNKINALYTYNTQNAGILDVYDSFLLTGFRSFTKAAGTFNQLDASSLIFNYQLGNWSDRFFINTFIFYNKNHDFFSTNTIIEQNFTQSEKILIKDRRLLNINTKLDYYFKSISSNLKLDVGYAETEYKNSINNGNLRKITSKNYNYGIELRSGFKGIFNYHIGTKWTTNKIETTFSNSFTDTISFLDLSFVVNEKLDAQLQTERYYFGNLQTDNTYYFLDFNANYKIIKDKLTLGLIGKNLFNTSKFRNFSISDIGTATTEYRLLPLFFLLKVEYRF